MKNKTIYLLLIISSLFSQIQREGTPKFYDNQINNIDYISPNSEYEINKEGSTEAVYQNIKLLLGYK